MEKLKSVFSPGSKADDDVLYGEGNSNNLGKVAGEGSHFGHSRTTDPSEGTTGSANAPTDTTTTRISTPGAANIGTSGIVTRSDVQSPSTDATKAAQLASKPHDQETQGVSSSNTQDPKVTTAALAASRADASHQKDTLPDRTVGATGTSVSKAGSEHPIFDQFASGAKGTSAHPQQHTAQSAADTAASTSTGYSNPYSSHSVDPRVDPSAHRAPKDHHIGRDVGLGGATAGAAVYEGNKLHEQHKPTAQSSDQPKQSSMSLIFCVVMSITNSVKPQQATIRSLKLPAVLSQLDLKARQNEKNHLSPKELLLPRMTQILAPQHTLLVILGHRNKNNITTVGTRL